MIEAAWQRAALLFEQQRWDLAERELRGLLAQDPDFAQAHALLGIVLSQSGDLDDALTAAQQAVALDPELDFGFRAVAVVHMERNELEPAAVAITSAIDLDPDDADHRGILAQIRFQQERWPDALEAADTGLAIDPQDSDCLNLRSLALTKLGRSSEALASVEASLASDPDNPYTHQARGYSLLHEGNAKQALHHFQEALRRDPTLDGARAGMVESIKSQNPIYRMVLAPFLWMERFPPQRRSQILIGAWLLAQVGRNSLAGAGYGTAASVVGFSWLGVVLLTACIVPIFNLLLLLHPVGRHALEASAKRHALLLGAAIVVTIGMFVGSRYLDIDGLGASSWFWLIYLLPVAGLGLFHSGWTRWVQVGICVGLLVAWAVWLWLVIDQSSKPLVVLGAGTGVALDPASGGGQWQSAVGNSQSALMQTHTEFLVSYLRTLILVAAFSTWFTLLAPKGAAPRRRR